MGGAAGMFAGGGNFGGAMQHAQAAGQGASLGFATGGGIAQAEYNASAMRMQAKSLEAQSDITAHLLRKEYQSRYQAMLDEQTRQQSWNRVMAAKRGITGASADETMRTYAAKGQKNLETLYYNAAMNTGQQSLQYTSQAAALYEKARQYDWQGKSILLGGLVNLGLGAFDQAMRSAGPQTPPYAGLAGQGDNSGSGQNQAFLARYSDFDFGNLSFSPSPGLR